MKEDKEKQLKVQMWAAGIMFSIIMYVAAGAISQKSTVDVLQEKVKEQKTEIGKNTTYIQDVDEALRGAFADHAEKEQH